jgi:Fe-S-cluster-containing dehydrogenase component
MAHHLDVDEYRLSVRTIGNGGIDEPIGVFPNLHMNWMPIFSKKCTRCADRTSQGLLPYCVLCCPSKAITQGDLDDPQSAICQKRDELVFRGYRLIRLQPWENTRDDVLYFKKENV